MKVPRITRIQRPYQLAVEDNGSIEVTVDTVGTGVEGEINYRFRAVDNESVPVTSSANRGTFSNPEGTKSGITSQNKKVIALKDVTMKLKKGEIMCLLGDNGAGKSTLIKTLAGVHRPDEGEIIVEGKKTIFDSPKDALDMGIATVYQDLALVSLMSVTRNFFMGREPMKGPPFFKTFDIEKANKIAAERMGQIGIDVRDPSQAVGTMSGGERQCLAISRAIYFGAKVLVLDEPTSALGVHQASVVLKYIVKAASQGLAVILITHNVHHAYPVGNSFTVLNRGKSLGTYEKKNISREKLLSMMAGGEELNKLEVELQEMNRKN